MGAGRYLPPFGFTRHPPLATGHSVFTCHSPLVTTVLLLRSVRVSWTSPNPAVRRFVRRGSPDPAVRLMAGLQVTRQWSGTGRPAVAVDGGPGDHCPNQLAQDPLFSGPERACGSKK